MAQRGAEDRRAAARGLIPVLLRTLSGAALLAALLLLAEPREILATLRRGDGLAVGAAAAPFAAVLLLDALRTALLFAPYELRYRTALRITLAGTFFGSFTPGTLGGEAYKVYFVQRRAPGLSRPIALTALLRLAGIAATLALALLYCAVYPERAIEAAGGLLPGRWSGPTPAIAATGALLLLLALLGVGLAIAAPRGRGLLRRALAAAAEAGRALRQIRAAQLAGLALISLLIAAARVLFLYLLARSLSPGVFLPDLAPVAAAALLGAVVPVAPGGLGTQEGALAAGLILFGLPHPEAVAVSLLNRGFLWAGAAAGWMALVLVRSGGSEPAP